MLGMLAVLLLAGCSAVDEDADDQAREVITSTASGSAVVFSVADSAARGATRTAQGTMTLDGSDGTVSLQEQGFGVFACHTGVHPYVSSSTTSNLMWNQLVTWDGVNSVWSYSPLAYWPNGTGGADEYVTFFAYAPHSEHANGCIADMSRPEEKGDPWILYQLGGDTNADGANGWKARQVDLLYDFKKDQRRPVVVNNRVALDFRHALACIGDRITVSCDESVATRLKAVYGGTPVTLTLHSLTVDYLLTRKGRLVLNNDGEPNWQAVESEDAKVHRYLSFTPNQVMAQATSASACALNSYASATGHGVFYIPLEVGADKQQVTVTADYTVTAGSPSYTVDEGTISTAIDLSFVSNASEGRDINVSLKIPEIECGGAPLSTATVGQIICSHGKVHPATTGALSCGTRKVAMVAYVGGSGEASPYNHGLAIALHDATSGVWCTQASALCLTSQATNLSMALAALDGISATDELVTGAEHEAAVNARNYRYDATVGAGSHPVGTSQWFLPSVGQWNLLLKAMTGMSDDLSSQENTDYQAANVNTRIIAAGGTGVVSGRYCTSTESSASNAWYINFDGGKTNSTSKTTSSHVRPVIAF